VQLQREAAARRVLGAGRLSTTSAVRAPLTSSSISSPRARITYSFHSPERIER
jgi:hypothetical protein